VIIAIDDGPTQERGYYKRGKAGLRLTALGRRRQTACKVEDGGPEACRKE
jgi:hypothetical protein